MAYKRYVFEGKNDEYPEFYAEAPNRGDLFELITTVTGMRVFYLEDPEEYQLTVSLFGCEFEGREEDKGYDYYRENTNKKYVVQHCSGDIIYEEDVKPMDFLLHSVAENNRIIKVEVTDNKTDNVVIEEIDSKLKDFWCSSLMMRAAQSYAHIISENKYDKYFCISYFNYEEMSKKTQKYLEDNQLLDKLDYRRVLHIINGASETELYFFEDEHA